MSNIAIRIDKLSKRYELGGLQSGSLREALTDGAKRLLGRSQPKNEFWALRDVSFDVEKGDVVGIVGHNGAGKSTLLKILSRITEPSSGRIDLYGRVTSLLEVGTGFHPELTGRENIFLNGSILGMRRQEIRQKFDEIVAFSGVEKFLDTPVKHYSSGMYVRLAFAVAAHLEAEILIIDEVLAVGDAEFQNKCLGKMSEVAKSGRTVLFVSHNMNAVKSLCNKGFLLRNGELAESGQVESIIYSYFMHNFADGIQHTRTFERPADRATYPLWHERISVLLGGRATTTGEVGDELAFDIAFKSDKPTTEIYVSIVISSVSYGDIVLTSTYFVPYQSFAKPVTEGVVRYNFGQVPLMAGRYTASFWIGASVHQTQICTNIIAFELEDKDIWGLGKVPPKVTPIWWNADLQLLES